MADAPLWEQEWRSFMAKRFAAGVRANTPKAQPPLPYTPMERCDGCGKWMTPRELAGVTEYGALCRECYEGTNDGR